MLILLLHTTLLQKQLAILIGIQYYFSLLIPILRMSNYLRTHYPYFTVCTFAIFRIACNSFLLGSYSDVLCGYGCIYYVCCSNLHSCSDTNTTAISRKDNGYAGSSCYVRSTYWTNGLRYFIRCIYTRNMGCYVCSFYCFNHDFNIFKKNFSKVRDIIQGVK